MQVPMRVRYFFTNTSDRSPNMVFWDEGNPKATVGDIRALLTQRNIIDKDSHLRFKEKISGSEVWLDISNPESVAPVLTPNLVDVKIVQQFHPGSEAFMQDLFGGLRSKTMSGEKGYLSLVQGVRELLGLGGIEPEENESREQTFGDIDFGEEDNEFADDEAGGGEGNYQEPQVDSQAEDQNGFNQGMTQPNDGYLRFDSGKHRPSNDFLGASGLNDITPGFEGNKDGDNFEINFDDPPENPRKLSEVDFLEGGSGGNTARPPKKQSNDLGGLEDLEGGVFSNPPSKHATPSSQQKPTKASPGGILDLNLDLAQPNIIESEHGRQVKAQEEKLRFANEIDPQVKKWQKDAKAGTDKDIRSLMISLKSFLEVFGVPFAQIKLTQVMSDGAVRKTYYKTIRAIHPDKVDETDPRLLYLYERISEALTRSFKEHKKNK